MGLKGESEEKPFFEFLLHIRYLVPQFYLTETDARVTPDQGQTYKEAGALGFGYLICVDPPKLPQRASVIGLPKTIKNRECSIKFEFH